MSSTDRRLAKATHGEGQIEENGRLVVLVAGDADCSSKQLDADDMGDEPDLPLLEHLVRRDDTEPEGLLRPGPGLVGDSHRAGLIGSSW